MSTRFLAFLLLLQTCSSLDLLAQLHSEPDTLGGDTLISFVEPPEVYAPSQIRRGSIGISALRQRNAGTSTPALRSGSIPGYAYPQISGGLVPGHYTPAMGYEVSSTSTGGVSYTIPLTYTGLSPMQPKLSLVYTSGAGDGVAGWSWQLQGASHLSAVGKSLYFDGELGGPRAGDKLPGWSAFALDGVRFVPTEGHPLAKDFPWITERGDILARIRGKGYEVRYPNGQVGLFEQAPEGQNPYLYQLTSLRDLQGNGLTYTYEYLGGVDYLRAIDCYRLGEAAPTEHIELVYADRPVGVTQYKYGVPAAYRRILKEVRIYSLGKLQWTYSLDHEEQAGRMYLKQVSASSQGEALNPLRMSYAYAENPSGAARPILEEGASSYLAASFHMEQAKQVILRGRFQLGEGGDGLLIYPRKPLYGITQQRNRGFLWGRRTENRYGSLYHPDQEILFVPQLTTYPRAQRLRAGEGFQGIYAVDVEGDGLDELVKINLAGTVGESSRIHLQIYPTRKVSQVGQADPEVMEVLVPGVVRNRSFTSPICPFYYWGSFLGDGRTQLLILTANQTIEGGDVRPTATLVDLESKQIVSQETLFELTPSGLDQIHVLDLDGDGRTDLCRAVGEQLQIYSYQSAKGQFDLLDAWHWQENREGIYWCDINGDGLLDYVCPAGISRYYEEDGIDVYPVYHYVDQGESWAFFLNTGHSFEPQARTVLKRELEEGESDYIHFQDLNQDGLADLIYVKQGSLSVYLNKHGELQSSPQQTISLGGEGQPVPLHRVTHDQTTAFMLLTFQGVCRSFVQTQDKQAEGLLTSWIDSRGVVQYNNYQAMRQLRRWEDCAYREEQRASRGYARLLPPWYVLSEQRTFLPSDLLHAVSHKVYTYKDLTARLDGLGLCGFRETLVTDLLKKKRVQTKTDPTLRGVVTEVKTYDLDKPEQAFLIQHYGYTSWKGNSWGKRWPYLLNTLAEEDELQQTTHLRVYYHDNCKQVVCEIDRRSSKDEAGYEEVHTFRQFDPQLKAGCYLLGQTKEVSQEVYRRQAEQLERYELGAETFVYDGYRRPVKHVTAVGPDRLTLKTEVWDYSPQGQLITEQGAPYQVTTLQGKHYGYDPAGHLAKETDALGLTVLSEQYDHHHHPQVVIDPQGNRTTYQYSPWGDLLSTISPDGSKAELSYEQHADGSCTTWTRRTDAPTTSVTYDPLGREVKQGTVQLDGTLLITETQYDDLGRISRVSLPHRSDSPAQWVSYTYDAYDRKLSQTEPSGKVTLWNYHPLRVTETKDGVASTRVYDAQGRLTLAEDSGGQIRYVYNLQGNLLRMETSDGAKTTFEYDLWGRQTAVNDPSAGRRLTDYRYDPDGTYTERKTSALGSYTRISDPLGRLIREERSGSFSTDYSYDRWNQLLEIRSSNGSGKRFSYDPLGRIYYEASYLDDTKTFSKEAHYDRRGLLAQQTYRTPQGEEFTEEYAYAYGHPVATYLSSPLRPRRDTLWRVGQINEFGQVTQAYSGEIQRTYSYNKLGLLTGRSLGKYQKQTYSFDPRTNNLISRSTNGKAESFGYDPLNRLTSWDSVSYTYSPGGNLLAASDLGSFGYSDRSHPYQQTEAVYSEEALSRHPELEQTQQISYTPFDRPATLQQGGYRLSWEYGADHERTALEVTREGKPWRSKRYWGSQYEEEWNAQTKEQTARLYLDGDAYSAPAVLVREQGIWKLYYIGRDHLGSITHLVTAQDSLLASYSYSPWGALLDRKAQLLLGRGYTGHEHLPEAGLILMNARLYDPLTGRFLSPDPYIQLPDFTQNLNRYSYCLNNPLRYTDPSGKYILIDDLIVGVLGGTFNLVIHIVTGEVKNFGHGAALFGAGFAGGVLTIYLGPVAGGAVAGGMNSLINQGFTAGWDNIDLGQILGASISGGLMGGLGSQMSSVVMPKVAALTSGITSPALRGAVAGSLSGAATGAGLGALSSWMQEEDVLQGALSGAATGASIGAVAGLTAGVRDAVNHKFDPWTGEKRHGHHSIPKVYGGDENQPLTFMRQSRHTQLHSDMLSYLKQVRKEGESSLWTHRNYNGEELRKTIPIERRIEVTRGFYRKYVWKYPDAAYDSWLNLRKGLIKDQNK